MKKNKYTDDNFKTLDDYYNDGYFVTREIKQGKELILIRTVKITVYEPAKIQRINE